MKKPKWVFLLGVGLGALLLGWALWLAPFPVRAAAVSQSRSGLIAASGGDEDCLVCHRVPGLRTTLPDGTPLGLRVDGKAYRASPHGREGVTCRDCHQDITGYPHPQVRASWRQWMVGLNRACQQCHEEAYQQYRKGGHAQALAAGNQDAALCTDCHGAHTLRAVHQRQAEAEICGQCHQEIVAAYQRSVHGRALTEGNPDVPTCTDCHQNHANAGPAFESTFSLNSPQICARCHGDKALMARYGLSTWIMETYVADFHGKTVLIFERLYPDQRVNKPVCVDCHGVHEILPPTEENSPVMQANLLRTCQRCHPNATSLNFSRAWLGHYPPDWKRAPLATLVKWFYAIVIPVTIGGMAFFVATDVYRRLRC